MLGIPESWIHFSKESGLVKQTDLISIDLLHNFIYHLHNVCRATHFVGENVATIYVGQPLWKEFQYQELIDRLEGRNYSKKQIRDIEQGQTLDERISQFKKLIGRS